MRKYEKNYIKKTTREKRKEKPDCSWDNPGFANGFKSWRLCFNEWF